MLACTTAIWSDPAAENGHETILRLLLNTGKVNMESYSIWLNEGCPLLVKLRQLKSSFETNIVCVRLDVPESQPSRKDHISIKG